MSLPAAIVLGAAVAVVFVRGEIFKVFRTHPRLPAWFKHLAGCPLCFGTWAGFAFALAAGARAPLIVLGAGCAAGCLALLFVLVILGLEARTAADEGTAKAQGGMVAALAAQAQAMNVAADADQQRNVLIERGMPPERKPAEVCPIKPVK